MAHIHSPASSGEHPFTEVMIRQRYKRPRLNQTTPLETRNRYTPLGDPKLKIARCDDGDSIPRTARRPPPIVIGTQVSKWHQRLQHKNYYYVRKSVHGNQRGTLKGRKRLRLYKHRVSYLQPERRGTKIKKVSHHGFDPEHPDDEITAELKDRLGEGFVKAHRLNKTNQDGS